MPWLDLLLLLVGVGCLVGGAEWLVRGAASIAALLGVPTFIVGVTIVALGTSAPELVVAVRAASAGDAGLVIGNVVGSNIANVALILGTVGLITPIACHSRTVRREVIMMLGATLIVALMTTFDDGLKLGANPIMRLEGVVLLLLFVFFGFDQFRRGRDARDEYAREIEEEVESLTHTGPEEEADPKKPHRSRPVTMFIDALLVIAGLALLVVGGELVVTNAASIAESFGVSSRVIGLTIVAVGTSLPELATAIVAALRKHADMVLGNVIGSNIFNLLLILGVASTVSPLEVTRATVVLDVPVMLALAAVCVPLMLGGRTIGRWTGGALVVSYVGYLGAVVLLA